MNEFDDDDERPPDWVARLEHEVTPPETVKVRVAAALRDRGLLVHQRGRRIAQGIMATAAGIALVAAGWLAGSVTSAPQSRLDAPEYMLLLFGGEAATPAEEDARVTEYRNWARTLASKGQRVSGERLADGAKPIGARGAPGEADALKGFFIIQAASPQDAEAIAAAHPHVRHGGSIVIRRIARGG